MTKEEIEYISTLPPDVIYIPTKENGHHSKEENEAYRKTSDETNARYRSLINTLNSKDLK